LLAGVGDRRGARSAQRHDLPSSTPPYHRNDYPLFHRPTLSRKIAQPTPPEPDTPAALYHPPRRIEIGLGSQTGVATQSEPETRRKAQPKRLLGKPRLVAQGFSLGSPWPSISQSIEGVLTLGYAAAKHRSPCIYSAVTPTESIAICLYRTITPTESTNRCIYKRGSPRIRSRARIACRGAEPDTRRSSLRSRTESKGHRVYTAP
jgi:hypothetical protein